MSQTCAICQRDQCFSSLVLEEEDGFGNRSDEGEKWSVFVCNTCWDIIAAIAGKVAAHILQSDQVVPANKPAFPSSKILPFIQAARKGLVSKRGNST